MSLPFSCDLRPARAILMSPIAVRCSASDVQNIARGREARLLVFPTVEKPDCPKASATRLGQRRLRTGSPFRSFNEGMRCVHKEYLPQVF